MVIFHSYVNVYQRVAPKLHPSRVARRRSLPPELARTSWPAAWMTGTTEDDVNHKQHCTDSHLNNIYIYDICMKYVYAIIAMSQKKIQRGHCIQSFYDAPISAPFLRYSTCRGIR